MNNSLFTLEGKVAVVTGAGGLLGLRHCQALANAGSAVIMTDILGEDDLSRKISECLPDAPAGRVTCVSSDVTSEESMLRLRETVLRKYRRIDVLVNNAAVNDAVEEHTNGDSTEKGFDTYPLWEWNRLVNVNLTGTFICCKIFGCVMARQGRGSIINIASTYGIVGPDQGIYERPDGSRLMFKSPAYCATKGGVLSLTRYLAAYWGTAGVRVNALSPGGTENNQEEFFIRNYSCKTMLNRMAGPDEYQGAVVFLASDASSYMTGANLIIDGGWTAW